LPLRAKPLLDKFRHILGQGCEGCRIKGMIGAIVN
jgi:hypothetical protein